MRKGLLGSLTTLLTGAGLALAQTPPADLAPAALRKPAKEAVAVDGGDPAFALPDSSPPLPSPAPGTPSSRPSLKERREQKKEEKAGTKADDKDAFSVPDDGNAFSAPKSDCPPPHHPPLFGPKPEFPHVPIEPCGRFWASAEYLYWYTKNDQTGPLVSTGTPASRGIPGAPGTTVLFDKVNFGAADGLRVSAGFSNQDGDLGVEGNFFQLEQRTNTFSLVSNAAGLPLLARPAINALNGGPTAELVAFPGAFAGGLTVHAESHFWGSNAYFVCPVHCDECSSVELLAGFQYLDLREDLLYGQTTTILPLGVAGFAGDVLFAPSVVGIGEHFGARNQFFGGEAGGQVEVRFGNYFLNAIGKLGVGETREVTMIEGFSSTNQGGVRRVVPGGVSALADNSGRHTQDHFALVPEVNVSLGFDLSKCVRLYIGYTFLYWSDVIRPGDQAATPVVPGLVPTSLNFGSPLAPAQPFTVFKHTDYFAQGVNFGVAIRY